MRIQRKLGYATVATVLAVTARPATAQGGRAKPAASVARAASESSHVRRVPISKSVFGDAGIIVNARDDGYIEIAAAGPQKTVLLQLRTLAARAWVDSTARMLKARIRRTTTERTYRSDIDEYGTSTTMAMTRKVKGTTSEYALFFSDDPLSGFTVPIQASEANVFVAIVRRAAATSAKMLEKPDSTATPPVDSAKPAPKTKKKPAAKPSASPPAKPA